MSPMRAENTLVLSDLHLGDLFCRAKLLLPLLNRRYFARVILNGDIFADSEIVWKDLPVSHQNVLIKIGELIRQGVLVIWIPGNHDENLKEVLMQCAPFMNVRFSALLISKSSYEWMHGTMPCIALHGHIWNPLDQLNGWFTEFILWVFGILKKVDIVTGWRLTRLVSRNAFFWKRSNALVQQGALNFAQENSKKIVFCGHTHNRRMKRVDGMIYANTGCWTDRLPTALMLTERDIILYSYSWVKGWGVYARFPL